jgi:PAS domain S-box-containing protein
MHTAKPPVSKNARAIVAEIFIGDSSMARQMKSFDWASTPIGDPAAWPVALRSTVTLLLGSQFPMFVAWGDELTFLYNDAYSHILGSKHPEALGRPFRSIWSEIWSDISPLIGQALGGEAVWLEDLPLRMNRYGYDEDTTFTFSYSPARNDAGEIIGLFCACTETTRQTIAERELRDREARLLFFDGLEERLFRSTGATEAMCAATEMLGLNLGASRCAYADVAPDADRFCIRSDYTAPGVASSSGDYSLDLFGPRAAAEMRVGETLVVYDVSAELAPAEGREMFQAIGIDAIICCPLIKDGRLAAMMAVHQDRPRRWTAGEIALVKEVVERCWAHVERVGAEARLRESEERLRLAVDNADVGFWDVDVIHDMLIWPPRTKAMFGISPDVPVTMRDFYDGLHPDDRQATSAAFAAAADPERRALYDVHYRTVGKEDGVVRWIEAKGRGVFKRGLCVRVAGTVVQITARKEAEEALRELNATLEARIATAVAEREEVLEALRQSQKMEAMGQLTGGVAHDFNNLLTPIVGSLDLLQRKGLGGEREQRLIAGAVQSAERARTLVQRLLAFARRQPLQPMPVDVAKLVSGMGELVSSTIGPQIRVVVEAPDDLPPALADPNQLEMAVLNLAVNARDAMPEGGTLRITSARDSVRIGHRSKLRAGHYIRLSVADTGAGMDALTVARAVEPFFSTKGIGKGTGLGLSMVHGLASQLGGAIAIQSQPGLGTNVELWLPQSTFAEDDKSTLQDAPAARLGAGTALLVDDEELVRMSTADMLHDLGYEVIEVASGEHAMRMVNAGTNFDLLVTDHLMPGMTGTELIQEVRSSRPGIPVLLVSGYAEDATVDPSIPRLTKPFRKDELAFSLAGSLKV